VVIVAGFFSTSATTAAEGSASRNSVAVSDLRFAAGITTVFWKSDSVTNIHINISVKLRGQGDKRLTCNIMLKQNYLLIDINDGNLAIISSNSNTIVQKLEFPSNN
jgi:hypothetical protein